MTDWKTLKADELMVRRSDTGFRNDLIKAIHYAYIQGIRDINHDAPMEERERCAEKDMILRALGNSIHNNVTEALRVAYKAGYQRALRGEANWKEVNEAMAEYNGEVDDE